MPGTNISPCQEANNMTNNNSSIKNSWSLVAFAKEFGSKGVRVGECTNGSTGKPFPAVAFTDMNNTRIFVSFSPKLGALTAKELVEQKDDLQVVLCETRTGKDMYSLCKQGNAELWGVEVIL